jgi:BioD-like phosphotransacetylase family protein
MLALYIDSVESAGKTTLCAGIGSHLLEHGKQVGFFMPVQLVENGNGHEHRDAGFLSEVLGLTQPIRQLLPVQMTRDELWKALTEDTDDFTRTIKKAYSQISRGKDIVIMEGPGGLTVDNVSTLACYRIVEDLDAKVVIALQYSPNLAPSILTRVAQELGSRLIGIIINYVPESNIEAVRRNLTAMFMEAGIKVLGTFPETRSLLGVKVNDLAEILNGELFPCSGETDEIIENVMLGAMTFDSGVEYFNRKQNKAVVIRGERADMQLAALETSTRCLILTGNVRPLPAVVSQAENKRVPLIVVQKGTSDTVTDIERAFIEAAFDSSNKLDKFREILNEYMDFESLYSALGVKF